LLKLSEGLVLGVATGPYCAAACGPALVPWLLGFSSGWAASARILSLFLLGRLLAYALFAVLATGGAGVLEAFSGHRISALFSLLSGIYLLLSFFMARKKENCHAGRFLKSGPLALGAITGAAPCPPLLGALIRALGLKSLALSLALFTGFFAATALFIIPAAAASPFLKSGRAQFIGRLCLAAAAGWFILKGFGELV